ncbi:restriction endonuclease subunit S [Nocardiopsis alba]
MTKWPEHTVKALEADGLLLVQDGNHGDRRPRRDEFTSRGTYFIRAADMKNGRMLFDSAQTINQTAKERIRKGAGKPLDVVLSHKGTVGKVAFAPPESPDFICSPQTTFWRSLDHSKINPRYLYFHLLSPIFTAQLRSIENSSDMAAYVSLTSQRGLTLALPPAWEQDAIATTLGALDDKIAANEHITKTIGELSSATYSSALHNSPDSFTETPLSDTSDFINGRAFTKDATGSGRMIIRIAEMNSGPGKSTVYNEIEVPEKHLANPGDILFSWSGSLIAQRWYRPQGVINQHIFKVVPKSGNPAWLSFELVKRKITDFRSIAADKATTMGHIQRRHLDETVPVPSAEMISKLDASLGPLWDRALVAEQEGLKLAELRDTLLPQLMSGNLRVKDAERIVEDNV